jgi:hypothetical protein
MKQLTLDNYDDFALGEFRQFSKRKLQEITIGIQSPVLEIGPSKLVGALNSPVFKSFPSSYFDVRANLAVGTEYQSMDIDPSVMPDILGSIESESLAIPKNSFQSVICFSILEHCKNPFNAVLNIHKILNKHGEAFFLTPWDLRFHGPRPDCWRISDDGYGSLLENKFKILTLEKLVNPFRPLSPFGIYCHAKKI